MPWKASMSRPTGRIHTRIPAISVDTPSATVASREILVLRSSHRDATRTATNATTPYTTAVAMTAMFCLPKPAEPAVSVSAYFTRQYRLKPKLSSAGTGDHWSRAQQRAGDPQPGARPDATRHGHAATEPGGLEHVERDEAEDQQRVGDVERQTQPPRQRWVEPR